MNPKLFSLLKYLDPNRITAEAVVEIAKAFGYDVDADEAAAIATAYKTRGIAGIVPHLPSLIRASQDKSSPRVKMVYQCKKCGHFGAIQTTIEEMRSSGAILDDSSQGVNDNG